MSSIFDYNLLLHKVKFLIVISFIIISCILSYDKPASAIGGANNSYHDMRIKMYMTSLSTLPTYCQYKLAEINFRKDFTSVNGQSNWPTGFAKGRQQWANSIGLRNWTHLHHYCFGIRAFKEYTNSSYEVKEKFKKTKLQRALNEFQYMKNAKTVNFPFWSDLYRYEGYIYLELGNAPKAKSALENSLRYKRN